MDLWHSYRRQIHPSSQHIDIAESAIQPSATSTEQDLAILCFFDILEGQGIDMTGHDAQ